MTELRRHLLGFPRYFAASLLALAVDTALLMAALRLGLALPWAAAIGFMAGMGVAYMASIHWAFTERRLSSARLEFLSFALIGLAGLGLTQLLLWQLVTVAGLAPLLAKGITAGFVFCLNFSLRKWFLFTRPQPEHAA